MSERKIPVRFPKRFFVFTSPSGVMRIHVPTRTGQPLVRRKAPKRRRGSNGGGTGEAQAASTCSLGVSVKTNSME